jgi:hypothetical protein
LWNWAKSAAKMIPILVNVFYDDDILAIFCGMCAANLVQLAGLSYCGMVNRKLSKGKCRDYAKAENGKL